VDQQLHAGADLLVLSDAGVSSVLVRTWPTIARRSRSRASGGSRRALPCPPFCSRSCGLHAQIAHELAMHAFSAYWAESMTEGGKGCCAPSRRALRRPSSTWPECQASQRTDRLKSPTWDTCSRIRPPQTPLHPLLLGARGCAAQMLIPYVRLRPRLALTAATGRDSCDTSKRALNVGTEANSSGEATRAKQNAHSHESDPCARIDSLGRCCQSGIPFGSPRRLRFSTR
jgi:hypothetical protein